MLNFTERIIEENLSEFLYCPICFMEYSYTESDKYPTIICKNLHSICKNCTKKYVLKEGQRSQCPICRINVEEKDFITFRFFRQIKETAVRLKREEGERLKSIRLRNQSLAGKVSEQQQNVQWLLKQMDQKQATINLIRAQTKHQIETMRQQSIKLKQKILTLQQDIQKLTKDKSELQNIIQRYEQRFILKENKKICNKQKDTQQIFFSANNVKGWVDLIDRSQILLQRIHRMKELPANIITLENLQQLQVSNCSIEELPENIGFLRKLEKLIVFGNKLSKLPKSINNLQNLQYLSAYKNLLVQIPQQICSLKKLRILRIQSNKIKGLPQQIGLLKSLQRLFLQKNLITAYPQEFYFLNVSEIELSVNQYPEFLLKFQLEEHFMKLKKITLYNCKVEKEIIEAFKGICKQKAVKVIITE